MTFKEIINHQFIPGTSPNLRQNSETFRKFQQSSTETDPEPPLKKDSKRGQAMVDLFEERAQAYHIDTSEY